MVISALVFPELGETVTNVGAVIENDFPLGLDRLNFCVFTSDLLFTNSNSAVEIFAVMSSFSNMATFKEKLAILSPALFLRTAKIPKGLEVTVANCAKSAPAMILVDVLNEASAMANIEQLESIE